MSPEELKALKVLAAQGNSEAQLNLGYAYYNGHGGAGLGAAVKWWRKAAAQGNAEAQLNLGTVCYNAVHRWACSGTPFWGEEIEAVEWWRKAAAQGNAEAQLNLGNACYTVIYVYESCYGSRGVGFWEYWGMTEDEVDAARWWRKAADQGNAEAQLNLGNAYRMGEAGVAEDKLEAVKWLCYAAAQGNAEALDRLGRCHYFGEGVAKDEVEAYAHYCLAGEGAQRIFAMLESRMSPDVRLRGQQRAKELQKEIEAKRAGRGGGSTRSIRPLWL